MRFLVIGGTGTIGISIVRRLLGYDHHVACMDVMPSQGALKTTGDKAAEVPVYRADISNLQSLLEVVKEERPDTVINLAYLMSTPTTEFLYGSARVNVLGIANIFEAARLMDVKRVVYASSVAVYGDSQSYYGDRPVREDDGCPPWDITRIYAATKITNELFARRYAEKYGLELVAVRPCIILAPGRESGRTATIARMIHWPPQGKKVSVPYRAGMPACVQYVEDTASVFAGLALKNKLAHCCYNSGGHTATLREIAGIVKKYVPDAEIEFDELAPDHKLVTKIDGSRIKKELGISFPSIEENIKAIVKLTISEQPQMTAHHVDIINV